ncbi:unnamed protein product [Calypogeia fissa]
MDSENGNSTLVANDGYSSLFRNGGERSKTPAHVLVVTIAFPGHFAPLVQLLYHLEAESPGLRVTVWGNKDRIADLQKLQLRGELKGLDLHLEDVFGEIPVYPDPKFPVRAATTSAKCLEECQPVREKLVAQKDIPGGPTAIVSDMFQYWCKDFADELGVPWYTYFSTSSLFLVVTAERDAIIKAGIHPEKSPNLNDLMGNTFPGLEFIRIRDLTEEVFFFEKFYLDVIGRSTRASAILLNTSEELDSLAGSIGVVRKLWPTTRILPVGPSLQYPGFGKVYTTTHSSSNCMEWLESQTENSVLYIAFGSLGAVSKETVMELAAGLEASGVPFLWALKVPAHLNMADWLPEGFLEQTKGQGIIVTDWAPQVRILAHSATGGFLSHCGWNSTLESLCSGVPIISWPLSAEQPMNARFIADVAKVGVAVSYFKDEDQYSFEGVTRQAVEKAVRLVMLEKKGEEFRKNAKEVQKSLFAAVAEGGSSYRNLHLLLDELTGKR